MKKDDKEELSDAVIAALLGGTITYTGPYAFTEMTLKEFKAKCYQRKERLGYLPREIARILRRDLDHGVISIEQKVEGEAVEAGKRKGKIVLKIKQFRPDAYVNDELRSLLTGVGSTS